MNWLFIFLHFAYCLSAQTNPEKSLQMKVLLFTKTNDYVHESTLKGSAAIIELGKQNHFHVDSTSDAKLINKKNLANYAAVIFYNTSGNILDRNQKEALQEFIRSGKGFSGIHGASNTEYEWEWYGRLIGAFFDEHPKIQPATIKVINNGHISTIHLPDNWIHEDEWYNFRNPDWSGLNVLMVVDESTFSGGKHGDFHPISWYHRFDGGRSWYTALGHDAESFKNPFFAKYILGGILYAAGKQRNE